jgi:hypothetical protein
MRENGSRLIVIPPGDFSKPLVKDANNTTARLAIPADQLVLAQIDQLHIEEVQVKELPDPTEPKPEATRKPEKKKPTETKKP